MLVVLAKLGTPETVGQFALGLAVTAPVIMFANLQLRVVQATDTNHEYNFADYFGLRLVMLILALLFTLGIVLVSGYQPETTLVILAISLGKAIDSISDVIYGLLQQHEQMDRMAVSMILKSIFSLIALTLGQYLTRSVFWASMGWSLASAIVLVIYDIPSGMLVLRLSRAPNYRFKPQFDPSVLWRLTWLALPLGLTMMLSSLNTNIPRYFVEHYSGERGLGIFAALAYLLAAQTVIVNALGQAVIPRLANYFFLKEKKAFISLLAKIVFLAVAFSLIPLGVAILFGQQVLSLLYQPEYAAYNDILVWLMMAAIIVNFGSMLNYTLIAIRLFSIQVLLFVAVSLSTLLTSLLLIPMLGLKGAVVAYVAGALVQVSGSMVIIWRAIQKAHFYEA